MKNKAIEQLEITRYQEGKLYQTKDKVVVEKETSFYIEDKKITLHHMPSLELELAIGHAITEAYIKAPEIYATAKPKLHVSKTPNPTYTKITNPASCTPKHANIHPSIALQLVQQLEKQAKIHQQTGGTHIVGLATLQGQLLYTVEDISRHCALDKVVGIAALNNIQLCDKILVLSSRITYTIIKKIINTKIPIAVTKAATTTKAIQHAKKHNLTLIAFTRKNRLNIYSQPNTVE